jgi:hypothetical protein
VPREAAVARMRDDRYGPEELQVRPDPPADARRALAVALEQARRDEPRRVSAWWRAGIDESVGPDEG